MTVCNECCVLAYSLEPLILASSQGIILSPPLEVLEMSTCSCYQEEVVILVKPCPKAMIIFVLFLIEVGIYIFRNPFVDKVHLPVRAHVLSSTELGAKVQYCSPRSMA